MASLRLAEKINLWDWGDIYVIQAVTRVRVHLSVCNVCGLRQCQEESSGMSWLRWQHFCYTGCCCLVRKQKKIKKLVLVKSGHSVLHERGFLLKTNAETSSSHYREKKTVIFEVYFPFWKLWSSIFQTNELFLTTWTISLQIIYMVATEPMKGKGAGLSLCFSSSKHVVTSSLLQRISFCSQGTKGNCQSQITGLAIS